MEQESEAVVEAGAGGAGVGARRPDADQRGLSERAEQRTRGLQPRLITLAVMFVIALVGAVYFVIARPDRLVSGHLHDEAEATGAERCEAGTEGTAVT